MGKVTLQKGITYSQSKYVALHHFFSFPNFQFSAHPSEQSCCSSYQLHHLKPSMRCEQGLASVEHVDVQEPDDDWTSLVLVI